MSINYSRQRIVLILACLLFVAVQPSCTAAEVEPQAEMEIDVVEMTSGDGEELSDTTIVEEEGIELETGSTTIENVSVENGESEANSGMEVSVVSANNWPLSDCDFQLEISEITLDDHQDTMISEATVVYTHTYAVDLWEWLPNSSEVLIQRGTEQNSPIELLNVDTGERITYATPIYASHPIWDKNEQKLMYSERIEGNHFTVREVSDSLARSGGKVPIASFEPLSSGQFDVNPVNSFIVGGSNNGQDLKIISGASETDFYNLPTQNEISFLHWLSDGQSLVVYSNNHVLYIFDLQERSLCTLNFKEQINSQFLTSDLFQSVISVRTNPVNNDLLFALGYGSSEHNISKVMIAIVDVDSNIVTLLQDSNIGWSTVYDMAWSPSGRHIALGVGSIEDGQYYLNIYDVENNSILTTSEPTDNGLSFKSLLWSSDGNKLLQTSGYDLGYVQVRLRDVIIGQ